jgi:hypothetical protein
MQLWLDIDVLQSQYETATALQRVHARMIEANTDSTHTNEVAVPALHYRTWRQKTGELVIDIASPQSSAHDEHFVDILSGQGLALSQDVCHHFVTLSDMEPRSQQDAILLDTFAPQPEWLLLSRNGEGLDLWIRCIHVPLASVAVIAIMATMCALAYLRLPVIQMFAQLQL